MVLKRKSICDAIFSLVFFFFYVVILILLVNNKQLYINIVQTEPPV